MSAFGRYRSKGFNTAFSLVEVLVSIGLLAIALLGVMGSIAYGTKHSATGEELTTASQLARQIFSAVQTTGVLDTTDLDSAWPKSESGLNDKPQSARLLNASPLGEVRFTPQQLDRYSRRIESRRLSSVKHDHRYYLAMVKVQVIWEGKHGVQSVEMTGIVSHARP